MTKSNFRSAPSPYGLYSHMASVLGSYEMPISSFGLRYKRFRFGSLTVHGRGCVS
ncbi:hypothetical protein HanRHA438_Chr13g0616081 [Helianthus annuus]|nr:hypothetical protein HanRHA438_Chr13g0616081 [Helianthus annuus]